MFRVPKKDVEVVYVVRSGRSWSVGWRRGGRTGGQGRRRHDASCSVIVVVDVADSAADVVTSTAPARSRRTPPRPRPQAGVHRRRHPGHYRHHRHRPARYASVVKGQSATSQPANIVLSLLIGTSAMPTTVSSCC